MASDGSCCDDCARELQKPWLEKAHVKRNHDKMKRMEKNGDSSRSLEDVL